MSTDLVGSLRVENHFPDCDAITVSLCIDTHYSVTVSKQEDGSVEVHVQDDLQSQAKVFTLGSEEVRDPHQDL